LLLLVAVSVGLFVSLLRKGAFHFVRAHQVHRTWLLVSATAAGVIGEFISAGGRWTLLSTVLPVLAGIALALFAIPNRRVRGMIWVAVGVALNTTVIFANRFMPVSSTQSGDGRLTDVLDGVHRLTPGPALAWLADVLRVPVTSQLLSVGDVLLLVGIARMTFALTQPPSADMGVGVGTWLPPASTSGHLTEGIAPAARRRSLAPETTPSDSRLRASAQSEKLRGRSKGPRSAH
jgi:hypothetical protein